MKKDSVNLDNFFKPETVAVIGASRNPNKVGHVVLKNLIEGGFQGDIIPINPNAEEILELKSYTSILAVKKQVDLAIIAVPVEFVLDVTKECKQAGIKDVIILTSGFREVGNAKEEDELRDFMVKSKMRCIGVNCLGVYDAYNKLDTLFIPRYRLRRPGPGGISFVCQSGAIGAAILDIAAEENNKFSKFISYGNATVLDESDYLQMLGEDEHTKVICLYVEGVRDGERFYSTLREVSKKKPIIAIKGGLTQAGSQAVLSHTGALAGTKEVYLGIFKQTGVIYVSSLEEMFALASLIDKGISIPGGNVQVITNGGGYGILSADYIANSNNMQLAQLSSKIITSLRKSFPQSITIHNPLDLLGDATTERYRIALTACLNEENIDSILLVALYQLPLMTEDIVDVIAKAHKQSKKPIIVVSTGGEFTEKISASLEEVGLPVFAFPEAALSSMDKLIWYEQKRKTL